jgi:hypothetical protein
LPVPLDRYLDRNELERRVNRDLAHRLSEAVDAAKVRLTDAFCGDDAFDVDANGEPIITVAAERTIDDALSPRWSLQDEFARKGGRA